MLLKLKIGIIERYRSQHHFAVACGKSENWISRIVHERDIPTEEEKARICTKLRVKNWEDFR